jgi:hypothetical protein
MIFFEIIKTQVGGGEACGFARKIILVFLDKKNNLPLKPCHLL